MDNQHNQFYMENLRNHPFILIMRKDTAYYILPMSLWMDPAECLCFKPFQDTSSSASGVEMKLDIASPMLRCYLCFTRCGNVCRVSILCITVPAWLLAVLEVT